MVYDRVQKQIHVVRDYQPDLERVYRMDGVLEQGLFIKRQKFFIGMLKRFLSLFKYLRTPCPRGIAL